MRGLIVIVHGTVDSVAELPQFLTNIRRGHPPSPELVAEVTRRYEAIGGRSPLNDITRALTVKLGAALRLPARACGRLFAPTPSEAIRGLAADVSALTEIVVLPLAQHSAAIYLDAVREAARAEVGETVRVVGPGNWGRHEGLSDAFAARVDDALRGLSDAELAATTVIFSAHSLPVAVGRAGDPYEAEFRASASDITARLSRAPGRVAVCFQSQGMSAGPGGRPIEWMGPDLRAAFEAARAAGHTRVVVAPVGFLADHVEILYDLDIEARAWASELSLQFSRTASLNADDALVDVLADLARQVIDGSAGDAPPSPQ
ncbi:MAG: ferrochelatase [Myxococcales bacterium]|nr:ferrochelatase [Myxococcales bacterium]